MSRRRRPATTGAGLVAGLAAGALLAAGCAGLTGPVPATVNGRVQVVAAENFWGSVAAQVGGDRVHVTSIITNPAQDPHSYEPTTADARTLATARLVIVNGVSYDPWAPKLLAADGSGGRSTLTVGALLHLPPDGNPHRWYDPADVDRVAAAIATTLAQVDPHDRASFAAGLHRFETVDLAAYHALIAQIRRRYAGVPVGASESIFALLAPALGLRLLTPPSFMRAISEGTDLTAQDTITAEHQITARRIKVWVENSQNVTPEIERLDTLARTAGVPVTTVTETLSPASDSFETWQAAQLTRLAAALHRATGR